MSASTATAIADAAIRSPLSEFWRRVRRKWLALGAGYLLVALLLAGADAVAILAPYSTWRLGFFERYDTAQVVVLGFFGLIAAYEGVVWSTSARSSSS